jgi:Fur family ferric uptake transcriptional regulator
MERWREEGWAEDAGTRGGEAVYVLCAAQGHHHHVVCVDCGATALLEGCALQPARESARTAGFDLLDAALASLPARCQACAGADEQPA